MYFGTLETLVLVPLPHIDLTFASPVFYVKMELAAFCVLVSFCNVPCKHQVTQKKKAVIPGPGSRDSRASERSFSIPNVNQLSVSFYKYSL
jgi:hypothetical protein